MEESNKLHHSSKKFGKKPNFFADIFFCWFCPTFLKGLKHELTEKDLRAAYKSQDSNRLGNKLEAAWKLEEAKANPSLWKALVRVFGVELAFQGFIYMVVDLVSISQPLCLAKLMEFYTPNQTTMTKQDAYMYAGFIIAVKFFSVLVLHRYMLSIYSLGMRLRISASSLIYRKALRLSKSSLAQTTVGQMVNLLSNDVNRFDTFLTRFHDIWLSPLQTVVILYFLYVQVGAAGLIGVIFLVVFIPFQLWLGKKTSFFRLKTAIRTDERVRLMNEIISGIQVIKMYTWEKPFAYLVEVARRNEIKNIRYMSVIKAVNMTFVLVLDRNAIFCAILSYILLGNALDHNFVYVLISFYSLLAGIFMCFPMGVSSLAEANVSVNRIKTFLQYNEIEDSERIIDESKIEVKLKNASTKWILSSEENVLHQINFSANDKQLTAIVGPVGCGKTTLLHLILNELSVTEGHKIVNGRLSYASQEPWIFSGSVRQNILFGEPYDEVKYDQVTQVCALRRDFNLFPYGDKTLVGDRGVMLSGGQKARINLARTIYKDADIYLLDDPLSAVDTQVGKQLFDECISGYLKNKCTILITHQLQYLRNVNQIYLLENGKVTANGTYEELQNLGLDFTNLLNDTSNVDEDKEDGPNILKRLSSKVEENEKIKGPEQEKEQRTQGSISPALYKKYLASSGSFWTGILILFSFVVVQVLGSGSDYFITFWVNLEQKHQENSTVVETSETFVDVYFTTTNCLIVYSILIALLNILTFSRSVCFFRFCMAASQNLHNSMFGKIVFGKMRFFNTNPSGRILNRFAKDIGAVDEALPATMTDTLQIGLNVIAITVLVAIVNAWVILPTFILLIIFYFMKIGYLASSRDIKRMEGTNRSPIFSHLSASLQGLTTIRAFKAEEILSREFDAHQNQHTSAYYSFLTASRTFGFWLDLCCVIYSSLAILIILFIDDETYGGNVGLAITQAIGLSGMFQFGMRQWSEMENQMTAVERVLEYTQIEAEITKVTKRVPKFWPEFGSIKFNSVSLRYSQEEPYVLKDLNFVIESREKIGIVGRTGAGKSSLIYALFRLTEIEGAIIIDNVNTNEIALNDLRSKISIIPQEPVLFSGTLRKNLDPFDEYNDETLWSALEEVELKNPVLDLAHGLDSKMSEGGSNFSVGQRQLVCLARAIIRSNKILVLDEATANVDPKTDALIQTTIRKKFADCTVLTIAHRLHTIMDSDKVLVMDAGSVVEFDAPHLLMQNSDGALYRLVQQTGRGMAENLTSIAEESYNGVI